MTAPLTDPATFVKSPTDDLDYKRDWSAWLATDETITTSEWVIPEGSLTRTADTHDDTSATIWLSGGDEFASYALINRITTNQERQVDREITVEVRQR